jgi:hypothetical protein
MKILDRIEKFKHWGAFGIVSALIIFIWLTIYGLVFTGISSQLDFEFLLKFATSLGGFCTFLSIILLYAALNQQSNYSRLNQIENKFFSQIQYHRDNASQMKYKIPSRVDFIELSDGTGMKPVIEEGGRVFIEIHREIIKAIKIIETSLIHKSVNEIYGCKSLSKLKKILPTDLRTDKKLKQMAIIDIAYLSVFFGLAKSQGRSTLIDILSNVYNSDIVNTIIKKLKQEIAHYDKIKKNNKTWKQRIKEDKHIKYFGGHQHRLGHYFRHIYQTVNYINDQVNISYTEKYEYIKTLRAQLSTYEQSVLFFNSISQIGRFWELTPEKDDINKQLITKYNFIKNIPSEFISEIHPIDFYPNVHYEGQEIPIKRNDLIEHYK